MKQLACLAVALSLILGILLMTAADVNHGHGPGYHAESGGQGGEAGAYTTAADRGGL